ncbi:MAG: T9SS type A sorting domain-containing protein [Crocinitomicaceae bacterium]|nr:T9SS type A sorting domain-containing protein [Flavobacteriales bacterium]NQZ35604.1 T9SS type A sorting domain-containing protein [Crocinitomicaceae bacterium]
MKFFLTLFSIGIISCSSFAQFDFSSDAGWTIVDLEYPGPGPSIAVQSLIERINIDNGTLNFINAPDAPNDIRCHRRVVPLCNNWVSEFDFLAGNTNPSPDHEIAYMPFVLTENDDHPIAITERVNWALSTTYTNNNAIGAYVNGTYDNATSSYSFYIAGFSKAGNQTWTNAPNSERIAITQGLAYHVTLERLDLAHGKITVENGSGFYETRCFDIDPDIIDLEYLQVSNNPVGGWSRHVTGWVDNIDIMNCITRDNCCIGSEIMGVSELCLPSTCSSYFAVNSGASNYVWTVTGGATIASGDGTNMIQVNFSAATSPVTISVTIDCGCTQTVLSKTIVCPSNMMIDQTNSGGDIIDENKNSMDKMLFQNGELEIYPNPSEGVFLLGGVDLNKDSYTVIDPSGQVIQESRILTSNSIDISNQEDGVYFLIISNGDNQRVIKLLKTKK